MSPTPNSIFLQVESLLALAQETALLAPKDVGAMGNKRWELRPVGPDAGTRNATILQLRANYKMILEKWKEQLWPRALPDEQYHLLSNGISAHLVNESVAPFRLYVTRYGKVEQIVVTAFVEAVTATIPCSAQMRCVLQATAKAATETAVVETAISNDKIIAVFNNLASTLKMSFTVSNLDDERIAADESFKVYEKVQGIVDATHTLLDLLREFHVPTTTATVGLTTESVEWRALRQENTHIFH